MLQKDTSLVTISELFQGHEIDIVTVDHDNPAFRYWFRATDVCTVLFAQGNAQRYTTQHCRSDQFTQFQVGKGRPANYICLSGVLRMAMRSDAPCAIAFQDWLSEEALPKLLTQGAYVMPTITPDQQLTLINQLITNRVDQTIQAVNDLAEMTTITAGRMKLKRRIATNLKYANNEKFPKDIEEELETLVQSGYSAEFFQSSIFSKIMTWADGVNQDANSFYQSLLSEADYAERQQCYRENRGRLESMIDTFTHKKADEAIRNNKAKMTSLRELEQYVEN